MDVKNGVIEYEGDILVLKNICTIKIPTSLENCLQGKYRLSVNGVEVGNWGSFQDKRNDLIEIKKLIINNL